MTITKGNEYINIKIPENVANFVSKIEYSKKLRIIIFSFSHCYNEKKVILFLKMENLEKSLRDWQKELKRKIPKISDSDVFVLKDLVLDVIIPGITTNKQVSISSEDKIDEIVEHKPESKPTSNLSIEEYYLKVREKYSYIKKICETNFPGTWNTIELQLSILKILNIKGCSLPFAGIILGASSSSKTLGIELLRKYPGVYYTDSFSAKAFVSHNTNVPKDKLQEIDLLPKIRYKCLLAPELSPVFSKKDDDLLEILGILTRVLDGHGYASDSGVHGQRGYSGEYMFTMIGAAVDIPRKVHRYLSTLGSKLYFYRLQKSEKKEEDYIELLSSDDFNEKKEQLMNSIHDYLNWFDSMCPLKPDVKSGLIKLEFVENEASKNLLKIVVKLGKLLAQLRGVVTTWNTEKTQGSNYGYSTPNIEEPDRAMRQLLNLAKGHAISQGRNYLTTEDIPILIKVALSTASLERVMIFDLLLAYKGKITASQISHSLKISRTTALKTMAELIALGVVSGDVIEDEDIQGNDDNSQSSNNIYYTNKEKTIKLEKQFEWFLSDEFQKFRQGFKPEGKCKYETQEESNVKKDNISKVIEQLETNKSNFPEHRNSNKNQSSIKKNYPHTDNWSSFSHALTTTNDASSSSSITPSEELPDNEEKLSPSRTKQEKCNDSQIDIVRKAFMNNLKELVNESLRNAGLVNGHIGISRIKLVDALSNVLENKIDYRTKIEIINKVIDKKINEGIIKINNINPIEYLVSESVEDELNKPRI